MNARARFRPCNVSTGKTGGSTTSLSSSRLATALMYQSRFFVPRRPRCEALAEAERPASGFVHSRSKRAAMVLSMPPAAQETAADAITPEQQDQNRRERGRQNSQPACYLVLHIVLTPSACSPGKATQNADARTPNLCTFSAVVHVSRPLCARPTQFPQLAQ